MAANYLLKTVSVFFSWSMFSVGNEDFVWKRILFYAFSPAVYTTTNENADENGGFSKLGFKRGVF